jgi:hypothetical protein
MIDIINPTSNDFVIIALSLLFIKYFVFDFYNIYILSKKYKLKLFKKSISKPFTCYLTLLILLIIIEFYRYKKSIYCGLIVKEIYKFTIVYVLTSIVGVIYISIILYSSYKEYKKETKNIINYSVSQKLNYIYKKYFEYEAIYGRNINKCIRENVLDKIKK